MTCRDAVTRSTACHGACNGSRYPGPARQAPRQATAVVNDAGVASVNLGGRESEPHCVGQLLVTPHPPAGGFGGQVT